MKEWIRCDGCGVFEIKLEEQKCYCSSCSKNVDATITRRVENFKQQFKQQMEKEKKTQPQNIDDIKSQIEEVKQTKQEDELPPPGGQSV